MPYFAALLIVGSAKGEDRVAFGPDPVGDWRKRPPQNDIGGEDKLDVSVDPEEWLRFHDKHVGIPHIDGQEYRTRLKQRRNQALKLRRRGNVTRSYNRPPVTLRVQ